ncbi:hypothetical protein FGB62_29g134 [Gracilaria domingensis]|nr:hypothetical protein FGB62_29g134 [Gracilaria domingensis]
MPVDPRSLVILKRMSSDKTLRVLMEIVADSDENATDRVILGAMCPGADAIRKMHKPACAPVARRTRELKQARGEGVDHREEVTGTFFVFRSSD